MKPKNYLINAILIFMMATLSPDSYAIKSAFTTQNIEQLRGQAKVGNVPAQLRLAYYYEVGALDKPQKSSVSELNGQRGKPLGVVDDDDFAAVYGADVEECSSYPKTLTQTLYYKLLDEKGKLESGMLILLGAILLTILYVTNKMITHPEISLDGSSSIVVSCLFFGALRGYFAHIEFVSSSLSVILLICLVVAAIKCYRQSSGMYKIRATLISLALGFVVYHVALMFFYALGWFIGFVLLAAISILFLVFVLKLDYSDFSTSRGSSAGGGNTVNSGSSDNDASCSNSGLCQYYNGYGGCSQHFDGIHNLKCNGHDYEHECSDYKEA